MAGFLFDIVFNSAEADSIGAAFTRGTSVKAFLLGNDNENDVSKNYSNQTSCVNAHVQS